jgi:hypothetical protein
MPPPMSRYHFSLLSASGVWLAVFQSRSSAALVPLLSPRDTNGACDVAIAFSAVAAALHMRGVGRRSDDDKVIPGDLPARRAVAFIHELLFGLWIVDQQEIGIAPPRRVQRLACALRDHVDRDAGPGGELRKNVRQ